METLKVKKLHPDARLPRRATEHSAGYDLCACLREPLEIPGGERRVVPCGIAIELPRPDTVALIFGRSGLGVRHGLSPSNAVGVVDADYRGEILVGLSNHSRESYTIRPGERIAQLVVVPVVELEVEECGVLSETARGEGGFGSTGRG